MRTYIWQVIYDKLYHPPPSHLFMVFTPFPSLIPFVCHVSLSTVVVFLAVPSSPFLTFHTHPQCDVWVSVFGLECSSSMLALALPFSPFFTYVVTRYSSWRPFLKKVRTNTLIHANICITMTNLNFWRSSIFLCFRNQKVLKGVQWTTWLALALYSLTSVLLMGVIVSF